MGKIRKAKRQEEETPAKYRKIFYSAKYEAYLVGDNSKLIAIVEINKDEFMDVMAGDIRSVYPSYDPEKHYYLEPYDYASAENGFAVNVLKIYEWIESPVNTMPYGVYTAEILERIGSVLKPFDYAKMPKYINIREDNYNLYSDLQEFLNLQEAYKSSGRRHKRGVLIYGPPGSGKTSDVLKVFENSEKDKIRVIFVPSHFPDVTKLKKFRAGFGNDTTVFIFEELTERVEGRGIEYLLSFLDGEQSWDGCYSIATTNYPEKLPANLLDRPGRFEVILKYDKLSDDQLCKYAMGLGAAEEEVRKCMEKLTKLSMDYISYAVFRSKVENKPLSHVIRDIAKQREDISKTFVGAKSSGIGIGNKGNGFFTRLEEDLWDD